MRGRSEIFYRALFLTAANLLLRSASMSFQVYLSRAMGAAGVGLLQLVLSVSGLSFVVGSAGARTCAMCLSARSLGQGRGARPVTRGCFHYALVSSGIVAVCLWRTAPYLAERWIGDVRTVPALRLCAAFLPLQCVDGVLTGTYTAAGRIRTLVAVQSLEQGTTMGAAYLLLRSWAGADPGRACVAVVGGSCVSVLLSLGILLALRRESGEGRPPYGRICATALPLAAADSLRAGLNTVEQLIVPKRLALSLGTAGAMAGYGVLHGMVFPLMMFPASLLLSLAELMVPEFSRCAAQGSWRRVRYLVRRGLRTSLLFGLAAGGVLFAAAVPLGQALYRDPAAGRFLRLYAPFVPLLYTDALVDAMCKGLGQQNANARYNAFTSLLDVALLWTLLPRLGMGGYYASFAATHLINFALSLRRLERASGVRLRLAPALWAMLWTAAASLWAALLPAGEGVPGAVLGGACFLTSLALLWTLFRVVGREDLRWISGLVGRRERSSA